MSLTMIKRELPRWLLSGAAAGLIILGVGGRVLMRIIAHMEHRPQFVLSFGGTLTVIFAGTIAGLVAGFVYALARAFVRHRAIRAVSFAIVVELIVWRGVNGLLPIPQLMFMALAGLFITVVLSLRQSTAGAA